MLRRVYFSYYFVQDIERFYVVRNSWAFHDIEEANIIDTAEFERIKQSGDKTVYQWIDDHLVDTSATVILIGTETLNRPYVKHEIMESYKRGNAIIGVYIHNVRNMRTSLTSRKGEIHTIIGHTDQNEPIYFDEICDSIYDYVDDNGKKNMGEWIESAVEKKEIKVS